MVGLTVDLKRGGCGFVLPLHLEPSEQAELDERLPFTRDDLYDVFAGLVRSGGLTSALPERLHFRARNPMGREVKGDSMHIAALLAVLDGLSGRRHRRLCGACAVVEPRPDGRFKEAGAIAAKLTAFRRECGRGSLLVCMPGCPEALAHRDLFDAVWEVDDYAGLAGRLEADGLLEPLLRRTEVSVREWKLLGERLERLNYQRYQHGEALDLGRRMLACTPSGSPPSLHDGVVRQMAAAHRHRGDYAEAEERGRELYERVRSRGDGVSDDEEADAAVEYVASFYDGHRFGRMADVLTPWRARVLAEPRRFRLLTRVKIFNTLGRAQVILGRPDWEDNFRRALALQRAFDPEFVLWTACYLVHGLLRRRRAEDAQRELEAVGPLEGVENPYSQAALRGLRAELIRQRGGPELDPRMEDWGEAGRPPPHVFAFYQQAIARRLGRPDASRRFRLAAEQCRAEAEANPRNVVHLFALCFDLAAATAGDDPTAWDSARRRIAAFLQGDAGLREYYEPATSALPETPDRAAAEALLDRIPYL